MTSGLLPPNEGLWFEGEQCGVDSYWEVEKNIHFDVDILKLDFEGVSKDKYDSGFLHGWDIEEARKYLDTIDSKSYIESPDMFDEQKHQDWLDERDRFI